MFFFKIDTVPSLDKTPKNPAGKVAVFDNHAGTTPGPKPKSYFSLVKTRAVCLILFVGFCSALAAAKAKASKEQPLVLRHADQMHNQGSGDRMWSRLSGDVEFQHGDLVLRSQTADYFRAEQRIEFQDRVTLDVSGSRLSADRMSYRKSEQRVVVRGNVRIEQFKDHALLTGQWGEYLRDARVAKMFGRPVLTRADSMGRDTVTITSDSMRYEEDKKKASAWGRVEIVKGKARGIGEWGEFYEDSSLAFLRGKPSFYLDSNRMEGDVIRMALHGEKLDDIFLCNTAKGFYREDPDSAGRRKISEIFGDTIHLVLDSNAVQRIHVLHKAQSSTYLPGQKDFADLAQGRFIRMEMDGDTVKSVVINGNASSVYYNREHDAITGKNAASGDSIRVFFDKNRVSVVNVVGAARGSYWLME